MQPDNELFRKEALKQLSSPDHLDQVIEVTTPKIWILLWILLGILAAALIWGFIGNIPTRVYGEGILLVEKGNLFSVVSQETFGQVKNILVKPGRRVQKGEVVAEIVSPELHKEVTTKQTYLQILKDRYQRLQQESKQQIVARKNLTVEQNTAVNQALGTQTDKLERIKELLRIRNQAFKKGLETKQTILESLKDFYDTKRAIDDLKNQRIQNNMTLANYVENWHQQLRDLDLKVKNEQHQLDLLTVKLDSTSKIYSPIQGVVVSIQKSIGDVVKNGESVISIASVGNGIDAMIYLAPQEGKKVRVNMPALVTPSIINKEEFGSVRSTVVSVSQYPVSHQEMMAILQNENLVQQFTKQGAPIAIRMRLERDANTFTGLKWTSSKGPNVEITPGTLAKASIVVQKRKPIALIIPAFKKMLGIEE